MDRKNEIFLLVSAAIFIDMMMYSLIIPIIPAYAIRLGADEMTIGVIFGAFSIALLCFSMPFGILSDRIGRTPLMVSGMLLMAVTNVVFAASGSVFMLILARIVQGISGAATWSAGLALIADTFDASERGAKLGTAMAIMSAGMLCGPVMGGIIFDNLGYAPTFVIPSLMALIVGILFLRVRPPARAAAAQGSYMKLIKKMPLALAGCSIAIVVSAMTFGIMDPFMPVYLFEKYMTTPTIIGIAFGAMSLLNILAAPLVGRLYDSRGGKVLMAPGLIITGVIIVVMMGMSSLPLTVVVFALLGISLSFGLTPMLPLLADLFGENDNSSGGFIYGIYNMLFSLGLAIGPLLGGALVVRFTLPLTLLGQSALLAATGLLVLLVIKEKSRQQPGH